MGVKNLWDVLEPCKKTIPLHHLQNKIICIDLSCWMVQLQCVNRSYCANKDRVYLRGLFHRVRALIGLNCRVIFVSDGSIPGIKLSTYRRRLNSRFEVAVDGINPENVTSLKRNKGSEFSCMIKEAKLLGSALGIPCLEGVEEAEAQCALLNMESLCDACFSSDSDTFLFGARTVYRDICLGEGGYVVCYEMDDIERKLGFGRNSLITLGLLLGSDYNQGVNGLRTESACQIVKSIGDHAILQRVASEGLAFAKKTRTSKKHAKRLTCNNEKNLLNGEFNANGISYIQKGHENTLHVVDAYLKPKCHSPDSDAVHSVLGEHPFQRNKLQELCGQFFEWPPEKTDEYILPKIAERNLRRFAALRSTSTELGVELPLDKMPVKCPVSEIIKPRKVQGRECFEVAWNELDGLETSIVPAELVERACHEKIMEFTDKKAMGKKHKPKLKPNRPKPTQKKPEPIGSSSIDELGLKLRDLEIFTEPRCEDTDISVMNQSRFLLFDEPKMKPDCRTALVKDQIGSCSSGNDVIDLLSPSPVCSRIVSRFDELKHQNATVIELTDSDTDDSPEHMTKAREFRMFLESIRNDLL